MCWEVIKEKEARAVEEKLSTWKLSPSFFSSCLGLMLGLGGGAGPALLGFLAGFGRVGGGSLRGGQGAEPASGMEGRGEGIGTW